MDKWLCLWVIIDFLFSNRNSPNRAVFLFVRTPFDAAKQSVLRACAFRVCWRGKREKFDNFFLHWQMPFHTRSHTTSCFWLSIFISNIFPEIKMIHFKISSWVLIGCFGTWYHWRKPWYDNGHAIRDTSSYGMVWFIKLLDKFPFTVQMIIKLEAEWSTWGKGKSHVF